MKILIPSAKQMSMQHSVTQGPVSDGTALILEAVNKLTTMDLAACLHINEQQAIVEQQRYQEIIQQQAAYYSAIDLFDGLMFRQINRQKDRKYYEQHLWIATALYGLIPATQAIAPHRLDFMATLKINGKSLKQFWRQQYDQIIATEEEVLSLLSSEFESVFSPTQRKKITTVQFIENNKIHSTISKKGRGQLIQAMAMNNCQTLDSIKKLSFNGYIFDESLSQPQQFVFMKND